MQILYKWHVVKLFMSVTLCVQVSLFKLHYSLYCSWQIMMMEDEEHKSIQSNVKGVFAALKHSNGIRETNVTLPCRKVLYAQIWNLNFELNHKNHFNGYHGFLCDY